MSAVKECEMVGEERGELRAGYMAEFAISVKSEFGETGESMHDPHRPHDRTVPQQGLAGRRPGERQT